MAQVKITLAPSQALLILIGKYQKNASIFLARQQPQLQQLLKDLDLQPNKVKVIVNHF